MIDQIVPVRTEGLLEVLLFPVHSTINIRSELNWTRPKPCRAILSWSETGPIFRVWLDSFHIKWSFLLPAVLQCNKVHLLRVCSSTQSRYLYLLDCFLFMPLSLFLFYMCLNKKLNGHKDMSHQDSHQVLMQDFSLWWSIFTVLY